MTSAIVMLALSGLGHGHATASGQCPPVPSKCAPAAAAPQAPGKCLPVPGKCAPAASPQVPSKGAPAAAPQTPAKSAPQGY